MQIAPVLLEGSFARLEPLRESHLAGLTAIGLDPDLWQWTTASVRSHADMRKYVEAALKEQAAGSALPFATICRSSACVVGSTRF
jgi:N-acetyltransferase